MVEPLEPPPKTTTEEEAQRLKAAGRRLVTERRTHNLPAANENHRSAENRSLTQIISVSLHQTVKSVFVGSLLPERG